MNNLKESRIEQLIKDRPLNPYPNMTEEKIDMFLKKMKDIRVKPTESEKISKKGK